MRTIKFHDSKSLARLHLDKSKKSIEAYIIKSFEMGYDDYTYAHLMKSLDTINDILDLE